MSEVETVTGPVSVENLGKTLIHEHFLFGYPGWQGDRTIAPFNREKVVEKGVKVAEDLKSRGIGTVVDATTNECGRFPKLLKEISERSGINIILSCGYYYEKEGAPAYFKFRNKFSDTTKEAYEIMKTETTEGIENTNIKPGVFKLASSEEEITEYESWFFKAAAKTSKEENTPIITHTTQGQQGPEQADMLISEGINPENIMIGHIGGNTDMNYLKKVLEKGVYIGFDRFGLEEVLDTPKDEEREECITELVELDYANRIMISHDAVVQWLGRPLPEIMEPFIENWHPTHIPDDIVPDLKNKGVSKEKINQILVENPKEFFTYN